MAYTTHPSDLGIDVDSIVSTGGPALQAVSKIVEDPALPEITCNVMRLNKAAKGQKSSPCARKVYSAADKGKGVGLHIAITPLRIATWARTNPVLAVGVAVGVVGALVGLGYYIGRKKRYG